MKSNEIKVNRDSNSLPRTKFQNNGSIDTTNDNAFRLKKTENSSDYKSNNQMMILPNI